MNIESQKLKILNDFRTQLIDFLDEIIEHFPTESEFVIIRMFVKDQIPATDILGRFIRDLLPFQEYVLERNENFFIQNTLLYTGGKISNNKINHFKNLWKSDKLDEMDRNVIWDWMNVFMKLADSYKTKFGYIQGWEATSTTKFTEN